MRQILLSGLVLINTILLAKRDVRFHWSFDDSKAVYDLAFIDDDTIDVGELNKVKESVNSVDYDITGLGEYVPGVRGTAFKFDGFSSYIQGSPVVDPEEDIEKAPKPIMRFK